MGNEACSLVGAFEVTAVLQLHPGLPPVFGFRTPNRPRWPAAEHEWISMSSRWNHGTARKCNSSSPSSSSRIEAVSQPVSSPAAAISESRKVSRFDEALRVRLTSSRRSVGWVGSVEEREVSKCMADSIILQQVLDAHANKYNYVEKFGSLILDLRELPGGERILGKSAILKKQGFVPSLHYGLKEKI